MMIPIVLISAVLLSIAYFTYGRLLTSFLRLDDLTPTPAVRMRDGVDYDPLEPAPLLSQHFSAIAAAGPIVGPILAGAMFGWMPALIWILVGAIFVGGVHDFTALIASVRHQGKSMAEVVRANMSQRAFVLFLSFVWLALVYIIVAFTDITATSFVGRQVMENGTEISGGGIATSSVMYLILPIIMGLLVRGKFISMDRATWIFLPLVGVAIWAGQKIPMDVDGLITGWRPGLSSDEVKAATIKFWDVALLLYCAVASVIPMWLLLQPRGQLGGYFLYVALGGGMLGLLLGGTQVQLPAYSGWMSASGDPLAPMLFITIACGACSGFHSLIASGTTSKQLRRESDAKPIGYGAMLLEGMVAVVSLCCVMMLAPDSDLVRQPKPNFIYAQGIGLFLEKVGIPPQFGIAFALMAFTTFIYDTLDVCTRLGRYIVQELTGLNNTAGRWLGTALTTCAPLLFIFQSSVDAKGAPVPVWKNFWTLFGASNQLLAALTLLTVTVWLWRTRGVWWVWLVTGLPMAFMYCMSTTALVRIIMPFVYNDNLKNPVPWVSALLLVLAAFMLVEAFMALFNRQDLDRGGVQTAPSLEPAPAV